VGKQLTFITLFMKIIKSLMTLSVFLSMIGCGVFGLRFHQTDAQEHDYDSRIMENVWSDESIRSIMIRHHTKFGENKIFPFLYVVSNGGALVYGELGESVRTGNGKYIQTTPNITQEEIETFWNVYKREVLKSGFKGKIVMDVYPDGRRKRYTTTGSDRGHQ
jgi:hypothetical protein